MGTLANLLDGTRRDLYAHCWAAPFGNPGVIWSCPHEARDPLGLCPAHHLEITGRSLTERKVS